jgi:hypothetical protein
MKRRTDPVLSDQGGRMTPSDPEDMVGPNTKNIVRYRAFELYEQRGRQDGLSEQDWLKAETWRTTRVLPAEFE